MASIVTDALTAAYKSTPTIYFYCKFNEQPRREANSIIRSLLKQLSVASDTLDLETLVTFRREKAKGYPTTSLNNSDAEKLFTSTASQTRGVFVVVDALDECKKEERSVLFSFLHRLLALDSCRVKIFLTSRPEDGLHQSFRDSRSKDLLTYQINVDDTEQDIEPYVTQRVDERIESGALLYGSPITQDFRQYLITTLTSKADGVFLWARYQLDIICELGNESEIRIQLTRLPKGLEATYMRIWDKIRDFPDMKSARAYRTLKWLLSATRPLKRKEIIMATAIKPLDTAFQEQEQVSVEYLISACGNLVYLDEKADVLRFVHFSVQEFLVRQSELKDAEDFVTDVCFTALGFRKQPTAIWGYAAYNWHRQARCWREINSDRCTLIRRFLLVAPRLKEWVTYFTRRMRLPGLPGELPQPLSRYGAVGVCAFFNLPIILDHLLQRNKECPDGDFSELVSGALLLAAAEGHFGVADLLVKAGANMLRQMSDARLDFLLRMPNSGTDSHLRTPNSWESRQLEWLRMMALQETYSPYPRGSGSVTALQVAAGGGHDKVVELLLEAGANVNDQGHFLVSRDPQGLRRVTCHTALEAACAGGFGKVVALLLNKGAALDIPEGWTPLQTAVEEGHGLVVELLLKEGANVNAQRRIIPSMQYNSWALCRNALQAACVNGDGKTVGLLIEAGADFDAPGGGLGTPLQVAAACGHGGVVELLLKAGANVNLQNPFRPLGAGVEVSYQTALQAASAVGFTGIVQQLLDAGANA